MRSSEENNVKYFRSSQGTMNSVFDKLPRNCASCEVHFVSDIFIIKVRLTFVTLIG